MKRTIIEDLIKWKNRDNRKPLILLGARQVGKTYILKQFGQQEFEYVAYINCDNNQAVRDLFKEDYNMQRIILAIGGITKTKVLPGKTLIILDEIQELDGGLTSLKYFYEDAPQYHVAVAGSMLGISLHKAQSFPVGKVNTIRMYPMSFEEFLMAKGYDQMVATLKAADWQTINSMHTTLVQMLREYYFVGGMPEAVKKHINTNDTMSVREVQSEILDNYDKDFSKHTSKTEAMRIKQVWQSIPAQLAKENKKFVYGAVKTGGRAKDYELAIQWLVEAGLVHKINRISMPLIPLKNYENFQSFKLYLSDCGLLGALNNTPPSMLLMPNATKFGKGIFTENYVCCALSPIPGITLGYFSRDDSRLEIDFLMQQDENVWPIEVKAEENLQSKSLRSFLESHPDLHGIRMSMTAYKSQDRITEIPLYAVGTAWPTPLK